MIGVIISFVVGVVVGYAFRGKEAKALRDLKAAVYAAATRLKATVVEDEQKVRAEIVAVVDHLRSKL